MTRSERNQEKAAALAAQRRGETISVGQFTGIATPLQPGYEQEAARITERNQAATQAAQEAKRIKAIAEGDKRSASSQEKIAAINAEKQAREQALRSQRPGISGQATGGGVQPSSLKGSVRDSVGEARTITPGQQTRVKTPERQYGPQPGKGGIQRSSLPGSVQTPQQVGTQKFQQRYSQVAKPIIIQERRQLRESQKPLYTPIRQKTINARKSDNRPSGKYSVRDSGIPPRDFTPVDAAQVPFSTPGKFQRINYLLKQKAFALERGFSKAIAFGGSGQSFGLNEFQTKTIKDPEFQTIARPIAVASIAAPIALTSAPAALIIEGVSTGLPIASITTKVASVKDFKSISTGEVVEIAQESTYLLPSSGLFVRETKGFSMALKGEKTTPKQVFASEVLSGAKKFPESPSPESALASFKNVPRTSEGIPTLHTSTQSLGRDVTVRAGPAGRRLLEDPGLYVSPEGRGSPHFLGIGDEVGFSLLPDLSFKLPTVSRIFVKDIRFQPQSVIKAPGFKPVAEFLKGQSGSGIVFITKRSTLRQTAETEGVLAPGTRFEPISSNKYTTFKGQVVPIEEFRILTGPPKPGITSYSIEDLNRKYSSSARSYSSSVKITPLSFIRGLPSQTSRPTSKTSSLYSSSKLTDRTSSVINRPIRSRPSTIIRSVSPSRSSRSEERITPSRSIVKSPPSRITPRPNISRPMNLLPREGGYSRLTQLTGRSRPIITSERRFTPFTTTTRTRVFQLPKKPEGVQKPRQVRFKLSQPRRYSPTLYSSIGGVKAPKGKKLKTKGLSGLEVRPI